MAWVCPNCGCGNLDAYEVCYDYQKNVYIEQIILSLFEERLVKNVEIFCSNIVCEILDNLLICLN